MNIKYILISLVTILFLHSCEKVLMDPKPGTSNIDIYDEYAKIVIEKFGLQEVKGIDLESLTDSIRPFITICLFVGMPQESYAQTEGVQQDRAARTPLSITARQFSIFL